MTEALQSNSTLRKLNLGSGQMRKEWCRSYEWNETKGWINDWTGNGIGQKAAEMISTLLQCNSSLTELNLSRRKRVYKKRIEKEKNKGMNRK